jgi:asparagine synthase (glutamine-hydrolysing)
MKITFFIVTSPTMCGIFAIFGEGLTPAIKRRIVEIVAAQLKHRGPDTHDSVSYDSALLVHTRLAIVDPEQGSQPFIDGKQSLVVNGEIYNHGMLREDYPKYQFHGKSDCEVLMPMMQSAILLAHPKGTKDTMCMIDGDFGFVYYDDATKRYFAARDRIGVFPLYMCGVTSRGEGHSPSYVMFSSELKAIVEVAKLLEVTPTIISFPPGHYITSDAVEPIRYYQMVNPLDHYPSKSSVIKAVRSSMIEAVIKRMMSDVPFAVCLSGGLDSSIVAAIATQVLNGAHTGLAGYYDIAVGKNTWTEWLRRTFWPRQLVTYAVGLKDSPDILAARKVAAYLHTDHREIVINKWNVIATIRKAIWHLETFDVASIRSGIPMMLMARAMSADGIRMALIGDGSDEIWAGYGYFKYAPKDDDGAELAAEVIRKVDSLYLYDCLRANKSMMAHSVESRCPFLDRTVVSIAINSVSPALKYTDEKELTKNLLRKAFEFDLPEEIVWRPKVQFSSGCGDDLIKSLIDYADEVITDSQWAARATTYPDKTPLTREAYLYRMIFEHHFGKQAVGSVSYYKSLFCSTPQAFKWFPEELRDGADPCGVTHGKTA